MVDARTDRHLFFQDQWIKALSKYDSHVKRYIARLCHGHNYVVCNR